MLQQLVAVSEVEIEQLKGVQREKESFLLQAEEQVKILQTELSTVTSLSADKDQQLNNLREEVAIQTDMVRIAKEEILAEVQEENSKQRDIHQHKIQVLKSQMETTSGCLKKAEEEIRAMELLLARTQKESAQRTDLLQQQLAAVNTALGEKEALLEAQAITYREKEALIQEKEDLVTKLFQADRSRKALVEQLEALGMEKNKLAEAMEREHHASLKSESVLQKELASLRKEKGRLLEERVKADDREKLTRSLQEQLTAQSEAAEHYKAQMEKAANHYNGKKQLLQQSQEQVIELQRSLEVKEQEAKAVTTKITLLGPQTSFQGRWTLP